MPQSFDYVLHKIFIEFVETVILYLVTNIVSPFALFVKIQSELQL